MNTVVTYFLYPISPLLSLTLTACLLIGLECIPSLPLPKLKFGVAIAGAATALVFTILLSELPPNAYATLGYYGNAGWLAEFWQSYRLDSITLSFYGGILVFTAISLITMASRFHDSEIRSELLILTLFIATGMMLLVSADNLLMVFLALELMSLPTYVLVGIQRQDKASCEAALKYFLFGSFASVLLIFGIALLYAQFGTLRLPQIAQLLTAYGPALPVPKGLIFGGLSLISIAAAFKVGVVPFHMWVPDAYEGASTPITGFMGSAVKLAGFGLAIRLLWGMFLPLADHWIPIMEVLAVASMFVGNVAALAQDNLKRMFAYSSIAHAGYLLLGVASVVKAGPNIGPLYYYLMVYGIMFVGLFAILAIIERTHGSTNIHEITGLGFTHPLLALCLAIFAVSAAGIPPTAGFFAKYFVFLEAVRAGKTVAVILAVISSVIGAYYYLRVVVFLYMKEAREKLPLPSVPRFVYICIVVCAGSLLVLAVSPSLLSSPLVN